MSATTPGPVRDCAKRPFVRPRLTHYGTLGSITMTSGSLDSPPKAKAGGLRMGSQGMGKGGWIELR